MPKLSDLNKKILGLYPGATTVVVPYSGSGDEGWCDYAYILGPVGYEYSGQELNREDAEVYEEVAMDLVGNEYGGYEINEGGQGVVEFNLERGLAVIKHSENEITEVDKEPVEVNINER